MAPNILWICTDQQRYDTLGFLGYGHYSTPHIDSLAELGTTFTHAYCQSPICTPSRASFLTGMYASAVHVNGNGLEYFPDRPPLVTKMFANAGYDCGLIGKLHLATASKGVEPRTDDGYSYWQYSHAPRDDWHVGHDYADWVRSKGKILGDLVKDQDGVPAEFHQTTWCAEKTIEFMTQERGEKPWLASVNIYDPHPPFNAPRQYREMFDPADMPGALFRESDLAEQERLSFADFQSTVRHPEDLFVPEGLRRYHTPEKDGPYGPGDHRWLQSVYAAMIKQVDDQLGRILAALDASGQRDNTIVIFTSDHGETLGDHGLLQKGCRFYEGLVRVPLIFSWPGQIQQGQRRDDLVELSDKAPTLLELCGQEVHERMTGKSLASILKQGDPAKHREFVRCEYYDALKQPDGTFASMYRDERWKLCVYHGRDYGELYDLQEDPNEFVNLWEKPEAATKRAELMKRSFDESMLAMDRGPRRVAGI